MIFVTKITSLQFKKIKYLFPYVMYLIWQENATGVITISWIYLQLYVLRLELSFNTRIRHLYYPEKELI